MAAAAAAAHGGDYLRRFVAETEWYNEVVLSAVAPGDWWRGLPHPVQSWMRNCVGGYLLYFISGFLWCFVIYYWKRHAYIPKGLATPVPPILPSRCFCCLAADLSLLASGCHQREGFRLDSRGFGLMPARDWLVVCAERESSSLSISNAPASVGELLACLLGGLLWRVL